MVEIKRGYCTLCRSRCGSLNHVEDGKLVAVTPDPEHPTGAALCAKGRAAPELMDSPRRLTKPLRRTRPRGDPDPGWIEISWDEALDAVATRLGAIRTSDGAEAVAFAVTTPSGTPMVDSFEWVERFIRCFGSPNLIYAVEICGWHKDYAHALTFGRGIGTADYERAETIVLWGHNPTRTWLAQATRIADARRRGATVVVIDPKQGGSGETADLWLPIQPGADGALAMGAIRHLLSNKSFDMPFLRQWTNAPLLVDRATGRFLRASQLWPLHEGDIFVVLGRDGRPRAYDTRQGLEAHDDIILDASAYLTDVEGSVLRCDTVLRLLSIEAAPFKPERVAELTRLPLPDIDRFYRLFEGSPRLSYHSWTGVGQHTNATLTERAIATLYALCGAVDREGGNLWTQMPPARPVNSYSLLSQDQQRKALGLADLPLGPPSKGWITARDFSRAVVDGLPYRVRALMSFGTNFIVSQGASSRNAETLQALDFHVHVDMFLNPTAMNADIVLPASMPWEREALRIGFEITQDAVELVQLRQKMVPVLEDCRADYEIAFELAQRLGHADAFFGGSIEAGWNYQLEPLGLTVAALRAQPGGISVPQPRSERKYAAMRPDGIIVGFDTPTRRVELYSELMVSNGYPGLPRYVEPAGWARAGSEFPLRLSTAKTGWYIHSALRHVASLRRKAVDPAVDISPGTAAARGIAIGDWVVVRTPHGRARLRARLDPTLQDGVAIAEFGWWEDCPPLGRIARPARGVDTCNINDALSDIDRDPVSGSIPLRAVACEISRDDAMNVGSWAGERAFRVDSLRRESAEVVAVTFKPSDARRLPDFLPGQHVIVRSAGPAKARAYSLTGRATDPAAYEIAVRLAGLERDDGPPGRMSAYIHGLRRGDVVTMESPSGTFAPPLTGERPVILLAAGVGITPFVPYIDALARQPIALRPPGVHLVYVCRDGENHPFGPHLRAMAAAGDVFQMTTIFTRPSSSDLIGRDYDRPGRSTLATMRLPFQGAKPLAYICGGDAFIADATALLRAHAIPRFDIFSEVFASAVEPPENLLPCSVVLARTGKSFRWTSNQGSLLDAADAAAFHMPSGCRAGQCESCSVKVLSGAVTHLSPYDGPPDHCLTCRAVPIGDVVLDA